MSRETVHPDGTVTDALGNFVGIDQPAAPLLYYRTDGAAVECPTCGAKFGGMKECPWDGATLTPLADADPDAIAFYEAIS